MTEDFKLASFAAQVMMTSHRGIELALLIFNVPTPYGGRFIW